MTTIGGAAFDGCSRLTSVAIPNSVTKLGNSVFGYCPIQTLYWDANADVSLGSTTSALKELYIGDNTTIIYTTFSGYSKLNKVVLGKNVKYLRSEAFKGCGIKNFYVTGDEAPYCYSNVFSNVDLSSATLYVPNDKASYYQTTEPWSGFGTILNLEGNEPTSVNQCATPTITYKNGNFAFTCETEGATIVKSATSTMDNDGNITLTATAYATAEGYQQSETATLTVNLAEEKVGDTNGDGDITMSDVMYLIQYLLTGEFPE